MVAGDNEDTGSEAKLTDDVETDLDTAIDNDLTDNLAEAGRRRRKKQKNKKKAKNRNKTKKNKGKRKKAKNGKVRKTARQSCDSTCILNIWKYKDAMVRLSNYKKQYNRITKFKNLGSKLPNTPSHPK